MRFSPFPKRGEPVNNPPRHQTILSSDAPDNPEIKPTGRYAVAAPRGPVKHPTNRAANVFAKLYTPFPSCQQDYRNFPYGCQFRSPISIIMASISDFPRMSPLMTQSAAAPVR
jgi:hypothetical protein